MTTIQLAIHNPRYSQALAGLLQQDGCRLVEVVNRPDLSVADIIVMDGSKPENLALFETQPERFVVITRKDAALLSRIWDAGVRHVVFEEDGPSTALLAVIAAELRVPHLHGGRSLPPYVGSDQRRFRPTLDPGATSCQCTRIRKAPF